MPLPQPPTKAGPLSLFEQMDFENYADVLVWSLETSRGRRFKNGEMVVIRYDIPGVKLAEAVYSRLMDAHLRPVPVANPTPHMEAEHYLNSSFAQLIYQQPGQEELFSKAGGVITILAPEMLGHLAHVDPRTIAEEKKSRTALYALMERRRRSGAMGWTMCLYPTQALANATGLSLEEYTQELRGACWLNTPAPLKEWKRIKKETDGIAEALTALGNVVFRVESADTDLSVKIGENRRFRGFTGTNVPGCEVFVSPDWHGINGRFFADMPSIYLGHLVAGAKLEFHEGVALRMEADKGLQFLQMQLYMDPAGRQVGEFSLTDKRHSRIERFLAHTLLDENFGGQWGNCHIALGQSLPGTFSGPPEMLTTELEQALGFNQSGMHWDLVNTGPRRVTAKLPGGEKRLVYEDGEFKV